MRITQKYSEGVWETQEFGFLLPAQHLKLYNPVLLEQDVGWYSNTTSETLTTTVNKTKEVRKWKADVFIVVILKCVGIFNQDSMHMFFKFC